MSLSIDQHPDRPARIAAEYLAAYLRISKTTLLRVDGNFYVNARKPW